MTGYNAKGDMATSNGNHRNGHCNGSSSNGNGNGDRQADDLAQENQTMCSRDCCGGPGGSQKGGNTCTEKKGKGAAVAEKVIPTPQSLL
ncbi:GL24608 [Drosophila persimilis]|uniref:GL24608 n=1 Tax=Drosophila persimilis TaxID=7234 RepID=B4H5W9_DROPE|nr:GL24608 [Drosophila persimilis]